MSQKIFTFAVLVSSLGLAGVSNAQLPASSHYYAQQIRSMDKVTVWNMLTSGGIGSCVVTPGSATTACNHYFKVRTAVSPLGGYPAYNTDNSTPSYYNGAGPGTGMANSRATPTCRGSAAPLPETGCLDFKGMSFNFTGGGPLNANESSTDMQAYVQATVANAIEDAADPCGLASTLANAESSLEMTSLNRSTIAFAANPSGGVIPTQCYQNANAATLPTGFTSSTGAIPSGTKLWLPLNSASFCQQLFHFLSFGHASLQKAVRSSTGTITAQPVTTLSAVEMTVSNLLVKGDAATLNAVAYNNIAVAMAPHAAGSALQQTEQAILNYLPTSGSANTLSATQVPALYKSMVAMAATTANPLPIAHVNAVVANVASSAVLAAPGAFTALPFTGSATSVGSAVLDGICPRVATACGVSYNCSAPRVTAAQFTGVMGGINNSTTAVAPSSIYPIYTTLATLPTASATAVQAGVLAVTAPGASITSSAITSTFSTAVSASTAAMSSSSSASSGM